MNSTNLPYPQNWTLGRVLDACAKAAGLVNDNHRCADEQRLVLLNYRTGVSLATDLADMSATINQVISSGDSIAIERVKNVAVVSVV